MSQEGEREYINGRWVPTWVVTSAHRKADETGLEHACVFRISNCGWGSDPIGAVWVAVPIGTLQTDELNSSPYVAIPGELV